jgi:hypothetical protein
MPNGSRGEVDEMRQVRQRTIRLRFWWADEASGVLNLVVLKSLRHVFGGGGNETDENMLEIDSIRNGTFRSL